MLKSKYGMLEIFRAAFSRRDAVILLRHLNRKFNEWSSDAYLEQFTECGDPMV